MADKEIKLGKVIDYLKGPYPVASFQKLCGITLEECEGEHQSNECDSSNRKGKQKIKIERKWLHWLMLFGTSLGDELFYSVFFTFWFFNVDGFVGRRVVAVWGICMYIGQSLKDIIRWPRPSSPPVVKMERKWELEYGMPSTHAIVGAAVPSTILFFTASRYEYPVEIGITIAVCICTIVCLSRLYLGMHSVLDIIAGLSLVAFLLPIVIPLVDNLDGFFLTHELGGFSLVASGVFLCLCYPSGDRWTPARGDTFVILGSAIGMNLGYSINYQLGIIRGPPPSNPPYVVMWPTAAMIMLAVIRQILGLALVILSKVVSKKLTIFIQARLQLQQHDSIKPGIVTELFTKFFCYVLVGFTVTHIAPNTFRYLQIERNTFHTEI